METRRQAAGQIDGVTVDPANYEVTADPDGGRLIVTFRAQFLRTLAFGERTITIVSDDGSASVSFRRDSARAVTSGGKDGDKAGVTSAATGDGFPMGGMAAALLVMRNTHQGNHAAQHHADRQSNCRYIQRGDDPFEVLLPAV